MNGSPNTRNSLLSSHFYGGQGEMVYKEKSLHLKKEVRIS